MPRFLRPTIKRLRVQVTSDGRLTPLPSGAPVIDEDAWWSEVLHDPRARGKPREYDTLWANQMDTAEISCSECHRTEAVRISDLVRVEGNTPDTIVSDAVATYVNCSRRAKRCKVGFSLRNRTRLAADPCAISTA